MDRPTTRVGVKDPVFWVEKGMEVHFSPIPNLNTIYVGSRIPPSKEWAFQAFALQDLQSKDSSRYVVPVSKLGGNIGRVDNALAIQVMRALETCESESLKLQNQER